MTSLGKTILIVGVLAAAALFTPGGCTPEQLHHADLVAADVNAVGTGLNQFADSPAGAVLPPQVWLIMKLLGVGVLAAFGIWEKFRAAKATGTSDNLSTTLRAVADAIDQSKPEIAKAVKGTIKQVMDDRQIRPLADAIVDEHRSKLTV